jgi:hypothetical protein
MVLVFSACAGGGESDGSIRREARARASPGASASEEPGPTAQPTKAERRGKGDGGSGRLVTIAAAGDISETGIGDQAGTSDLVVDADPDRVLVLGDAQYEDGSLSDFNDYYDPTWGRFKSKSSAAPGNHDEYGSSGYDEYFQPPGPWYSFDLGNWHVVSLDSNRPAHQAQLSFMERDLAADDHLCEIAFWHHPRWSSGSDHGSTSSVDPLWERAVRMGVDIVLAAHDHLYERFARLDVEGNPAPKGTLEIIVGTGGAEQHDDFFAEPLEGSRVRIDQTHGVALLTLREKSFSGGFMRTDGRVLDRFSGACS